MEHWMSRDDWGSDVDVGAEYGLICLSLGGRILTLFSSACLFRLLIPVFRLTEEYWPCTLGDEVLWLCFFTLPFSVDSSVVLPSSD